jgi:hypothetical protein
MNRSIRSLVYNTERKKFVFYLADGTIEEHDTCTLPAEPPDAVANKLTPIINPLSTIESEKNVHIFLSPDDVSNISLSTLESSELLRPMYLPCRLMEKFVILTDIYYTNRVKAYPILSTSIYICEDPFDFEYFSKDLGLKTVRRLDDLKDATATIIDINPRRFKNINTIYTLPPSTGPELYAHMIHEYYTLSVASDRTTDIVLQKEFISDSSKSNTDTLNVNYAISAANTLKILLIMLIQRPIKINMRTFVYIEEHLNAYREFVPRLQISGTTCSRQHTADQIAINRTGFMIYDGQTNYN